MKAIALIAGKPGAAIVDRPEPAISAPDDVKLRVLRVGICGTDREQLCGAVTQPPAGSRELVIGHEMFGQVVAVGPSVTRLKPGDYAVFTVRRGCAQCVPCRLGRSDMCRTGDFLERGLKGLDGYQAEFVVDRESYAVSVPPSLASGGVLLEPFSIVEKAVGQALRLLSAQWPEADTKGWFAGRRCLVAGLGPIGLLAAMLLRLRGAQVYGVDLVDSSNGRARWLQDIGGQYVDGRRMAAGRLGPEIGAMDLILDASGAASLHYNLPGALDCNGVYVLVGLPTGDGDLPIGGAELVRQLVLKNQVILGIVNSAACHFAAGVRDLEQARGNWGDCLDGLITERRSPEQFVQPSEERGPDSIKQVVEWASAAATA